MRRESGYVGYKLGTSNFTSRGPELFPVPDVTTCVYPPKWPSLAPELGPVTTKILKRAVELADRNSDGKTYRYVSYFHIAIAAVERSKIDEHKKSLLILELDLMLIREM